MKQRRVQSTLTNQKAKLDNSAIVDLLSRLPTQISKRLRNDASKTPVGAVPLLKIMLAHLGGEFGNHSPTFMR